MLSPYKESVSWKGVNLRGTLSMIYAEFWLCRFQMWCMEMSIWMWQKGDDQSRFVTPGAPEKVAPQSPRSNITAESTASDTDDAVTGSSPSKMVVAIKRQEEYCQGHMLRYFTRINAVSRQKTSNCRIRNGSVARRSKAIFRSCLLSCSSEGKDTSPSGEARQTVR
jgi:hypothetical protein